jgi:hypothetical protein
MDRLTAVGVLATNARHTSIPNRRRLTFSIAPAFRNTWSAPSTQRLRTEGRRLLVTPNFLGTKHYAIFGHYSLS